MKPFSDEYSRSVETSKPELSLVHPTPQSEYDYVTNRVIKKLDYYINENDPSGIVLPAPGFMEKIQDKSQIPNLYYEFAAKEYDPAFYTAGLVKLQQLRVTEQVEKIFPALERLEDSWGFLVLPKYYITVSKYGPGSVIREGGVIVLRTDAEGNFARPQPAESVTREIVCAGIGRTIHDRFNLQRKQADKIADYIILGQLGDVFPQYRMPEKINRLYLEEYFSGDAILDLPNKIEKLIEERKDS